MGSKLEPVLEMVDPSGRVVATSDSGLLAHRCTEAGVHAVGLRQPFGQRGAVGAGVVQDQAAHPCAVRAEGAVPATIAGRSVGRPMQPKFGPHSSGR